MCCANISFTFQKVAAVTPVTSSCRLVHRTSNMGSSLSVSTLSCVSISTDLPKHGVRLQYVDEFISSCGGAAALRGLTTDDVCKQFVMPHTAPWKCSYCELLSAVNHPALALDGAIFISHAWKYEFLAVIEALQDTFRDTPDVVLWFDIFTINQHNTVTRDFDWWCTTFKSAIAHFGHTVMVLAPWMDPIPLTRAWCLFELWATVHGQCKFEVAMSASEIAAFLSDICRDTEGSINKMLSTIDVGRSTAYHAADAAQIKEAVQRTVGFGALNKIVFEQLRSWMVETTRSRLNADPDNCDLNTALGRLYHGQGRYVDAEPLLLKVKSIRMQTVGEHHLETLSSMNFLANLYFAKGDYAAAEPLYQAALAGRRQALGDTHPDTLSSMDNLASLYKAKGDYAAAEPLYQAALAGYRQVLGDTHPDTLGMIENMRYYVLRSSWLYKIGSFFLFEKRRWFVMEGGSVSYYTNETRTVKKGQFDVQEVVGVTALVVPAMTFSIITSGVHGGIFKCRCSSQEDYDGWVAAFRRCGLSV